MSDKHEAPLTLEDAAVFDRAVRQVEETVPSTVKIGRHGPTGDPIDFDPAGEHGRLTPWVLVNARAMVGGCEPLTTLYAWVCQSQVLPHPDPLPLAAVADEHGRPDLRDSIKVLSEAVALQMSRRRAWRDAAKKVFCRHHAQDAGTLLRPAVEQALLATALEDVAPDAVLRPALGFWAAARSTTGLVPAGRWRCPDRVVRQLRRGLAELDAVELSWLAERSLHELPDALEGELRAVVGRSFVGPFAPPPPEQLLPEAYVDALDRQERLIPLVELTIAVAVALSDDETGPRVASQLLEAFGSVLPFVDAALESVAA